MKTLSSVLRTEVVVIGAGQSGLSVGYHLKKQGIPFVILDANERVGDTWRKRWDSLRLFTPARYDGLVGMPFPASRFTFPTKDEMADYLETYAEKLELPVETGVSVHRVSRRGNAFVVSAGRREIEAAQVVVAMANYQTPIVPPFASKLRPDIVQLHSTEYRNPSQLRDGPVLVVGAGNSGSEIAMELTRHGHQVSMAGRDTGHVPFQIGSFIGRHILAPLLLRVVFHRLLTLDTPMGRRAKPTGLPKATPLIRVKPKELAAAGVARVSRVAGVHNGLAVLTDGQTIAATNVIWCTGFEPGFSWLDLPVFDHHGQPMQRRGVVEREPGLYFVGLHFLYSMSSSMIQGAARDSEYVAAEIVRRSRASGAPGTRLAGSIQYSAGRAIADVEVPAATGS